MTTWVCIMIGIVLVCALCLDCLVSKPILIFLTSKFKMDQNSLIILSSLFFFLCVLMWSHNFTRLFKKKILTKWNVFNTIILSHLFFFPAKFYLILNVLFYTSWIIQIWYVSDFFSNLLEHKVKHFFKGKYSKKREL